MFRAAKSWSTVFSTVPTLTIVFSNGESDPANDSIVQLKVMYGGFRALEVVADGICLVYNTFKGCLKQVATGTTRFMVCLSKP